MEESLEQIYKFYEDLFNNLPAGATEEVSMAELIKLGNSELTANVSTLRYSRIIELIEQTLS